MANPGYLALLLNGLPEAIKKPLIAFSDMAFKDLALGAPDEEAVATENFRGHLVPVTTHASANTEVAVAHKLGRVPRLVLTGILAPDTVNATTPVLTITRAADATYLYVKSPTTTATTWIYVE